MFEISKQNYFKTADVGVESNSNEWDPRVFDSSNERCRESSEQLKQGCGDDEEDEGRFFSVVEHRVRPVAPALREWRTSFFRHSTRRHIMRKNCLVFYLCLKNCARPPSRAFIDSSAPTSSCSLLLAMRPSVYRARSIKMALGDGPVSVDEQQEAPHVLQIWQKPRVDEKSAYCQLGFDSYEKHEKQPKWKPIRQPSRNGCHP